MPMTGLRIIASQRYFEQSFHEALYTHQNGLKILFKATSVTLIKKNMAKAGEEVLSQVCFPSEVEN